MLPSVKKILLATDLGADSGFVFRYALSQAVKYKATISIIHVIEPLSPFAQHLVELHISHDASEKMHLDAREKVRAQIVRKVDELCKKELANCGADAEIVQDVRVVEDLPSRGILQEAERVGADLVVMGTHRHSALGDALLGSTTLKVIHGSPKPVLLVRVPNDYRED